jgi:hypothetical protein
MTKEDGGNFIPARIKAECKNCGQNRWATVVGYFSRTEEHAEVCIWAKTEFRILQCPACDEVSFQTDSIFSEDYDVREHPGTGEPEYEFTHTIEHWPPIARTKREKPNWVDQLSLVDDDLLSLFSSVYASLEHDKCAFRDRNPNSF